MAWHCDLCGKEYEYGDPDGFLASIMVTRGEGRIVTSRSQPICQVHRHVSIGSIMKRLRCSWTWLREMGGF